MKPVKSMQARSSKLRRDAGAMRVRAAELQVLIFDLQKEAREKLAEAAELDREIASRQEANRAAALRQYDPTKAKETNR